MVCRPPGLVVVTSKGWTPEESAANEGRFEGDVLLAPLELFLEEPFRDLETGEDCGNMDGGNGL